MRVSTFEHDPNRPIGTWSGVHVEGGKLKGTLNLATNAFGLSEKARQGIDAGVYKAISIGFIPTKWEFDRSPDGNIIFHESELLEGSLVAIGASRGALREHSDSKDGRAELLREIQSEQRRIDAKAVKAKAEATRPTENKPSLKERAAAARWAGLTREEKHRERLATLKGILTPDEFFRAEQRMLRQRYEGRR